MQRISTTTLVRRAQQGDRDALDFLFERAYPNLVQAARFRLGPDLRARMDTTDIVHSAYFEAFRSLSGFDPRGKGSFHRWLLQIVENKIRERLRYAKAQRRDMRREVRLSKEPPIPAPSQAPVRKLIDEEDQQRLEWAMDTLPDHYREVIIFRYYLEMPWRDIGEQLGRSMDAAQMLCHRALLKLKHVYFGKS
jgi:RNA polymerase sigma-70 factor (ECF subfamily)